MIIWIRSPRSYFSKLYPPTILSCRKLLVFTFTIVFIALAFTELGIGPAFSQQKESGCTLWNFDAPKSDTIFAVATNTAINWFGGTKEQCEQVKARTLASMEKSLKNKRTLRDQAQAVAFEASRVAWKAHLDWVVSSSKESDARMKIKREMEKREQEAKAREREADQAVNLASQIYLDFITIRCTCVQSAGQAEPKKNIADPDKSSTQKRDEERKRDEAKRRELEKKLEAANQAKKDAQRRLAEAQSAEQKQAAQASALRADELRREAEISLSQISSAQPPDPGKRAVSSRTNQSLPQENGSSDEGRQLLSVMPDPFGDKNKLSKPSDGEIQLPDPFAQSATIRAPDDKPLKISNTHERKELEKEVFEAELEGAEKAIEIGDKMLTDHLNKARRTMGSKKFQAYRAGVEDVRSLLNGLDKFVKYTGYVGKLASGANEETDYKRREALGEVGFDIVKDIASHGIEKYSSAIFGPRIATVLTGPVGWVAGVAADVLTPVSINADPPEIIRDKSGKYSINEKQEALAQMWREYNKSDNNQWKSERLKQLQELTNSLFKEVKDK